MAKYNPFFEKAGMQRITESKPNPHITNALAQLEKLGFNPELLTNNDYSQEKITITNKPNIVNILTELSRKGKTARKALLSLPTAYPTHQAFTNKLSQLGTNELATVLQKLSFLNQTKTYLTWKKPNPT
jgi:hypothetical protein